MQFRLRTLFILVSLATIPLVALALLPHPRSFWLVYEGRRQFAYEQISVGATRQEAIELLGQPRSTESYFSREIAYRKSEFKSDELEACVEFSVWNNGGNWFYCLGFDDNGKVVLKAEGNS